MKQQKGFTLIELMIVIAIMGILAIIAIPMYADYTIRARVSEGMHLSSAAKLAVAEVYNSSGNFASDNSGYGLPASSAIHGNHVSSVSAGTNGDITITFRGSLGGTADDKTIVLHPDAAEGSLVWTCDDSAGTLDGTMPGKYRPANCRP